MTTPVEMQQAKLTALEASQRAFNARLTELETKVADVLRRVGEIEDEWRARVRGGEGR
jgi:hypothetical protein